MKKQLLIIGITMMLIAVSLGGCLESNMQEEGIVVLGNGMSHGDSPQNGIIDKGDIVYYGEISNKSDIITWVQGITIDYEKYGDYGDVILFNAMNDSSMQIIHRAMCWMEYHEEYGTYSVKDYGIVNVSNITITEFGLDKYMSNNSGFITRGDKNPICAQASGVCSEPVKLEWVIGKIVKLQDK